MRDGTTKPFKIGDKLIYIPLYLLKNSSDIGKKSMIKTENLGIVTSKNDKFVFVRYLCKTNSQATNPEDLYPINHRPDLQEILNKKENEKEVDKDLQKQFKTSKQ